MLDLGVCVLCLEELVEERDNVSVYVVGPEAACCACLGIAGQQRGSCVQVFEVLHDDAGVVGRPCRPMAQSRHQTPWIDVEKGLRFSVGVDFDVLVGDALVLERYPGALDEGAEG